MSAAKPTGAISQAFARCRKEKRAAFIPYITGGDPDLATTGVLLEALAKGGADLIEVGVPFSDPIADGPANQRAATRALAAGADLSGLLEVLANHRTKAPEGEQVPILLFTYFNPIHARGVAAFAEQAARSGVDGVLCLDLPPEEGGELREALAAHGLDTIYLLAPTSTPERIKKASAAGSGFVYYVSRTGVTGAKGDLPAALLKEVKAVRKKVKLPLAVGFGITTPDQVEAVGWVADGVVVGSELVRLVEERGEDPGLPALLEARVRALCHPLRKSKRGLFRR